MTGPVVDPAYLYGLGAKNSLKNVSGPKIMFFKAILINIISPVEKKKFN